MKIYIPYYDRGYHVMTAEAEACRALRNGDIMYAGTIYGAEAFRTEAAAVAYIHREYVRPEDRARVEEVAR